MFTRKLSYKVISLKGLYLFLSVFVLFWVFPTSCLVLFLSLFLLLVLLFLFSFLVLLCFRFYWASQPDGWVFLLSLALSRNPVHWLMFDFNLHQLPRPDKISGDSGWISLDESPLLFDNSYYQKAYVKLYLIWKSHSIAKHVLNWWLTSLPFLGGLMILSGFCLCFCVCHFVSVLPYHVWHFLWRK